MAPAGSARSMKTVPIRAITKPASGFSRISFFAMPKVSRRRRRAQRNASQADWWFKRKTQGREDQRCSSPVTSGRTPVNPEASSPHSVAVVLIPVHREPEARPAARPATAEGRAEP